jgi:hypothetical protein
MILEVLLIGGAIGLLANNSKNNKNSASSYSSFNYQPRTYNSYNYDSQEEDEENEESLGLPAYFIEDFNQDLSFYVDNYLSSKSYKRKKRFKSEATKIYYRIIDSDLVNHPSFKATRDKFRNEDISRYYQGINDNLIKHPSFRVVIELYYEKQYYMRLINEGILENIDRVFLSKVNILIQKEKISIIKEKYGVDNEKAKKYSYLKGVLYEINPKIEYLINDEENQYLFINALNQTRNKLKHVSRNLDLATEYFGDDIDEILEVWTQKHEAYINSLIDRTKKIIIYELNTIFMARDST